MPSRKAKAGVQDKQVKLVIPESVGQIVKQGLPPVRPLPRAHNPEILADQEPLFFSLGQFGDTTGLPDTVVPAILRLEENDLGHTPS